MEGTRIEIQKNGIWVPVLLNGDEKIRYNAVINDIGSINERQISHTDTVSLPYVSQNIKALDLNFYNKKNLAKSFNKKYPAKYFIEDKIVKRGFLVINTTEEKEIKINFIDEALDIIEKWGSMSYFDLLNSRKINIPSEYKVFIDTIKNYNVSKFRQIVPVGIIQSKGFHLLRFPNTLNAIGENFQKTFEKERRDDAFNPYQSRPIFNVKAFLDIIIRSFGYVPFYDNSIDWKNIENTYMVNEGLSGNKEDEELEIKTVGSLVESNKFYQSFIDSGEQLYTSLFIYPSEISAGFPIDLSPTPNLIDGGAIDLGKNWETLDRCIVFPNSNNLYDGVMKWEGDISNYIDYDDEGLIIEGIRIEPKIKIIWASANNETIVQDIPFTNEYITDFTNYLTARMDIRLDKLIFEVPPQEELVLVGVVCSASGNNPSFESALNNMVYTETYINTQTVTYDDYDQYSKENVNLTHGASTKTIKELLSGILKKEGILISFENEHNVKKVKLFSYGSYSIRKEEGKFRNWSNYFRKYDPVIYNSDYGNDYAKINEVGLSSPFKGNTYKIGLINQGANSKYKDYAENFVEMFKDVKSVNFIDNTINKYFEYLNEGLGLVEDSGKELGVMTQFSINPFSSANKNPSQGTISSLPIISNVNYSKLPLGWIDWYSVVDKSIKCEATFLLPINEIKNLKLSEPVYIEDLGGFYIIEKIAEYVDSKTPVKIKLIKLDVSQTFKFNKASGDFSNDYSNEYVK